MAKGSLLSLVILFVVVAGLCAVGFVVYNIATDVGHTTRQKMEKRNISFSKDGMKVGVKERSQEQQGDSAQRFVSLHVDHECTDNCCSQSACQGLEQLLLPKL